MKFSDAFIQAYLEGLRHPRQQQERQTQAQQGQPQPQQQPPKQSSDMDDIVVPSVDYESFGPGGGTESSLYGQGGQYNPDSRDSGYTEDPESDLSLASLLPASVTGIQPGGTGPGGIDYDGFVGMFHNTVDHLMQLGAGRGQALQQAKTAALRKGIDRRWIDSL
ncbi:MAG: hypothetical protein P4N41_25725 [Negativicutes bacterium]|nr:hypothetical protein [Negativicutes bacterium]MDR3593075.1 hypothetical protein [Negativicutes bacterium]